MFSIQNVYNSATAALFGIKKTDPSPYSFRIEHKGSTNIVFGPACWSISANIAHRKWLKDNGFDMTDIDRLEKILIFGPVKNDDKNFVSIMNKKLHDKELRLGLDQKKWCAEELKRIEQIPGLEFVKSSNIAGALTLWHDIKSPIKKNCMFHKEWASSFSKNEDRGLAFVAEFLHWKLITDKECRKNPSSCIKRYGIIIDKINY